MLTRLVHITTPIFFSKLVYPKQRYCDFLIFEMAATDIFYF